MARTRLRKATRKTRTSLKKAKKKAASAKKQPTKAGAKGRSVRIGLHGLGNLLRAIHRGGPKLRKDFEKKMGAANLTVNIDTHMAKKLKNFSSEKLGPTVHNKFFADDCDCDPVNDPWCICF
jgi:hypothetical protein